MMIKILIANNTNINLIIIIRLHEILPYKLFFQVFVFHLLYVISRPRHVTVKWWGVQKKYSAVFTKF